MNKLNRIKQFLKLKWFEKFSYKIANIIYTKYEDQDEQERKDFEYFFHMLFATIFWISSCLVISIFFNCWLQCIGIIFSFAITRRLCGGDHSSGEYGHIKCFINMNILVVTFSLLAKYTINYYILVYIITFGLILSKNYIIPKPSENTLDFNDEEIFNFRKKYSIITSILYFIVGIFCYIGFKYNYEWIKIISISFSYGTILSWFMITDLIEKIFKFIWKKVS